LPPFALQNSSGGTASDPQKLVDRLFASSQSSIAFQPPRSQAPRPAEMYSSVIEHAEVDETDPDYVNPAKFVTDLRFQEMPSKAHTKLGGKVFKLPLMSNYWNIGWDDLVLDDKLGEGSFATCFKGTLWGKEVAVKVLKPEASFDELSTDFFQEVNVLSMLRHPNCVLCK
jgi:hypothetical protein